MKYLFALVILLFCAPAVFVPASRLFIIYWTGLIALVAGVFGIAWTRLMPANFLAENPGLVGSPLNPELSFFYGSIFLLFAIGIGLALIARVVLVRTGVLKLPA